MNFVERCVCGGIVSFEADELAVFSRQADNSRERIARKKCASCAREHSFLLEHKVSDIPPAMSEGEDEWTYISIHLKNSSAPIGWTMRTANAADYVRHNFYGRLGAMRGFHTVFDSERPSVILAIFSYDEVASITLIAMKRNELGKLEPKDL